MIRDTGGHEMLNAMSERNRSRSPHMRMPSPGPGFHGEANAVMGSSFVTSSYPPAAASASYNSYVSHSYPSILRAAPSPFPPTHIVHVIHHSKHHSSSNKHHHKHSGHGYSHSHTHTHPQPRLPSPSPVTSFPSPSFPISSPHIHFPTVPYHPQIQTSPPNHVLHKSPSRGYLQSRPPLTRFTKPKPLSIPPDLTSLPVEPLNPDFQYSKCTGRRRALCIGINYRGQENELRGCINDAKNVVNFLMRNNYKPNEITILTDETNDPRTLPTRNNILEAMCWLVRGAKSHDSLFFHYSGHGGQTRDLDGDEADGWDEGKSPVPRVQALNRDAVLVIFPLDFRKNGHIVDDLMHEIMVRPLPRKCRLTGLFDACHSGSVLDLQYIYSAHGRLKGSPITRAAQNRKATSADVISWSACEDGQTSADTFAGGVALGAMSYAFITALSNKPEQTYQELLRTIRLTLHPRYSQKPQLGSSHLINMNLAFIF